MEAPHAGLQGVTDVRQMELAAGRGHSSYPQPERAGDSPGPHSSDFITEASSAVLPPPKSV